MKPTWKALLGILVVLAKGVSAPVAKRWIESVDLRGKVAQLVMVPFYGEAPNTKSEEYKKYVRWVHDLRVGGLVLVNRVQYGVVQHSEPYAMAAFLNRMQKLARIPLLVAGDFERGVSMRVQSESKFPHAMALAATGDASLSRYEGAVTAQQARALGVHWILAPVADVNNNPDNPIINIRSYGEDPEEVAAHVRAFLEGAQSERGERVLTTVKHFPGHGDTATDTHLGLAVLEADRGRLEKVELVPFRAAIRQGVDAVMSAHIAAPALDSPEVPSTLSAAVLTGLLRNELGFRGLIVTDALDMQGITKQWGPGEAAVKALEAGADVLLMPPKPEEAIEAVLRAVEEGRLSHKRIEESVSRILAAKIRVGLDRRRLVDLEAIADRLDSPEMVERAQEIADRAVTLVKNEKDLVPLRGGSLCFLVLSESYGSTAGRRFAQEVQKRLPKAEVSLLNPLMPDCELEQVAAKASACDVVIVAAFVSAAAYRGNVALAGGYPKLVNSLVASSRPVVLIALGSPYLARSFPGVSAYLTTYSTAPTAELAAVKALFGEIPIQGRLPVTIPGVARYGEGIRLPAPAR